MQRSSVYCEVLSKCVVEAVWPFAWDSGKSDISD